MRAEEYAVLTRARERILAGDPDEATGAGGTERVREPIRESWTRARRRGLDVDGSLPPVPLVDDDLERRRRQHPLARLWPTLRACLRSAVDGERALAFVSDADGHLLWVEGDDTMVRRAERVRLLPGARWSEQHAGTSGVGTALALSRPFQVLGPEHFLSAAAGYLCTAAPIRDPTSGNVLGAVDLTGGLGASPALALSLVTAAAAAAEGELRVAELQTLRRLRERYAAHISRRYGGHSAVVTAAGVVCQSEPAGWLPRRIEPVREGELVLPDGRAVVAEPLGADGAYLLVPVGEPDAELTFVALNREHGQLWVAGRCHELSQRQTELMTILLAHPEGLGVRRLCEEVYGPAGRPATLRAAIARLRPMLGHRLASGPYRILGPVRTDFLAGGYAGETLVPGSRAPGVLALRSRLGNPAAPESAEGRDCPEGRDLSD